MTTEKEGMLDIDFFMNKVEQLEEYELAHEVCLHFLEKNGNSGEKDLRRVKVGDLLDAMLNHFSGIADTNKCDRTEELKQRLDCDSKLKTGNTIFRKKAEAIITFEYNCNYCWNVIETNGMMTFGSNRRVLDSTIEGLPFTIRILNFFDQKQDAPKVKFLQAIIDELIREDIEEDGQEYGTKRNRKEKRKS